jgi:hypothetical protein
MLLSRSLQKVIILPWVLFVAALFLGPLFGGEVRAQMFAQTFQPRLLGPDLGNLKPNIFYSADLYSEKDVAGQEKPFSVTRHSGGFSAPIFQDGTREWSAGASVRVQDIKTDAVLPQAGVSFPQDLWNVGLGTQYRQRLDNGWIVGGSLSIGSASDKPFHSYDELAIHGTGVARVPHGDRNAWLFFVNYSNNREFLNHVPIPGFGYWYSPSDELVIVAGFPFIHVHAVPYDGYSIDASYFPVRNAHLKLSKSLMKELRLYTAFQWRNEIYFRAGRGDSDARLFYYEKRAAVGIEYNIGGNCTLDLSGGYAFDRFYFEGENYSDRYLNRLDIGDGPYVSARLGVSF